MVFILIENPEKSGEQNMQTIVGKLMSKLADPTLNEDEIHKHFKTLDFPNICKKELENAVREMNLSVKRVYEAKIHILSYYYHTEDRENFAEQLENIFNNRLDNDQVCAYERQYGSTP